MTKILLVTVLTILLLSGYSSAETNETVNVDELAIPDYGPHIFEELKNEPGVIDVRGTMPTIVSNREKLEWTDKLVECSLNLDEEMHKYFEDGPILSFGTNVDGYLKVGCDLAAPEKVNSTVIDEIYGVIDAQCKKEGINDVPVVFVWTEMATEETPGFTSVMLILCILILIRK
jgi:hypothetical protein